MPSILPIKVLQVERLAGLLLRREGDSNPRYAFDVYTLSRRASSTTRASLLMKILNYVIGIAAKGAMQIGCKDSVKRREYKIKKAFFVGGGSFARRLQGGSRLVR